MKNLFLVLSLLSFFASHIIWDNFASYRFTAKLLLLPAFYFAFMRYANGRREKIFSFLRKALTLLIILGISATVVLYGVVLTGTRGDSDVPCDYVIVLGAGIEETSPSKTLTDRLERAVEYLGEHTESIALVSGSQGEDEEVSEAFVMKEYLISRGISEERIIEEDRADNTNENMKFSFEIIKARGGGSIAVISSDYHIFRARRLAENAGFSPVMISAKTSSSSLFFNALLREAFALVKAYIVFI